MDVMNKQIGIIVLAAGGSTRLKGKPKQLLEFEGKTLLRRAVEAAIESIGEPVIVILGANFDKTKTEVEDLPVKICFNRDWQSGLSSSIKRGLEKLLEINPAISAVIFTLCDQPFIKTEMLDQFIKKFQETKKPIIAAEFEKTVGVPALFAREFFDELQKIENDKGAKSIIKNHQESLGKIALPEAGFDVDTIEDYENLKRYFKD